MESGRPRQDVLSYKDLAGISKRGGVHVFGRHTPATIIIENGADIRIVQEVLRHRDIRTTSRYAHVADKPSERGTSNAWCFRCFFDAIYSDSIIKKFIDLKPSIPFSQINLLSNPDSNLGHPDLQSDGRQWLPAIRKLSQVLEDCIRWLHFVKTEQVS